MALGAVAGVAATFVMQGMLAASKKWLPESKPPIKKDPGEFMVEKVPLPEPVKPWAAKSLHLGYGTAAGVLYAALRPRGAMPLLDGALLGIGVWAAGYLGWLPATGLMPPLTEQTPQQIAVPIVQHAIFGVAVATAYDGLTRL